MSGNNYSHYVKADGLRHFLQERYNSHKEQFPSGNVNYVSVFHSIECDFNTNVHINVVPGAALHGDGLLNDHGVDHIKMVMDRAGKLISGREDNLSGYELYILLMAIHFHDIGNVEGRQNHEQNTTEVALTRPLVNSLAYDELRSIILIASAHGGLSENGSKDTISALTEEESVQGVSIRPRLLASLLRFADEIADDSSRANRFYDKLKKLMPEGSVGYHDYSKALMSVIVCGNTLRLGYYITEELAVKKTKMSLGGNLHKVYLYDEILKRLSKCMRELEYCSKFSKGLIAITTISVDVTVCKTGAILDLFSDSFKLELSGYPSGNTHSVKMLVKPCVRHKTGSDLAKHIKQMVKPI